MFLSIIVPVYKVEQYLAEALDSLLDQDISQEDYEIICVNDGSPDGCEAIIEDYARHNSNIVLVNKENGGLSSARNAGLERASGKYIWFVDSDDFVQPNVLGGMRSKVMQENCDRLLFEEVYEYQNQLSEEEQALRKAGQLKANTKYGDGVVWTSIYKKELLDKRKARFSAFVPCYGEDVLFNYELNIFPYTIAKYSGLVYYYRRRDESIMTSSSPEANKKRVACGLEGATIMNRYYIQQKSGAPNNNELSITANLVMFFLRPAIYAISTFPKREANDSLALFRERQLFPYSIPKECTITNSRMTLRNDWVGRLYNQMCLHASTRWGYKLLRQYHIVMKYTHRKKGNA